MRKGPATRNGSSRASDSDVEAPDCGRRRSAGRSGRSAPGTWQRPELLRHGLIMEPFDQSLFVEVLDALTAPSGRFADAERHVPDRPGLYAVHGERSVWAELGLGTPPDGRPLYLGKAESSLVKRDLRTHFTSGRTGSSTLRRSLAGLLADSLCLEGRPRNPARPERFANFGLEAGGDVRLTEWMRARLALAVWPSAGGVILDHLETAALEQTRPPLNLSKVATPWREIVQAGRRRLAAEAEAWAAQSLE